MHQFEITQTNVAAVADPDDVVLREELDDADLDEGSLPVPPRALRVDEAGPDGERRPVPEVVSRTDRLSLEVPAGAARMVVLALDAEGQVIASRDLEVETAMTAEVFLDLLAAGLDSVGLDAVDLHVRLTPELASALAAAARQAKGERRPARALPTVPLATAPRRR